MPSASAGDAPGEREYERQHEAGRGRRAQCVGHYPATSSTPTCSRSQAWMNSSISPSRTALVSPRLDVGAQVLGHTVGVQHVGADLVAPARLHVLALDAGEFGLALLQLDLEQTGTQHLHGGLAVTQLGALVLAGHHDTSRQVREAYGRVVLLHVLAAVAARAVGVDAQLLGADLDLDVVVLRLRHHLDESEAGVARVRGVEGRDPHQPVHPALRAQ